MRGIPGQILESLRALLCEDGQDSWDFQPIGSSWKDNGVVILRPVSILGDGNEGKSKLQAIAGLLGISFAKLSRYHLLEIWDDR